MKDQSLTPQEAAENMLTKRDFREAVPYIHAMARQFDDDTRKALRDRARQLMRGQSPKDTILLASLAGALRD